MIKPNILFLITARGGSKGVPQKNIRTIDGIPLVAYKIIAAKKSEYPGRVIVSTDSLEIAEVSKKWGGEVPFIRPDYLASDSSSSMDVVEHAMNWIEENDSIRYSHICLLEPSSPFTTPTHLKEALDLIVSTDSDTLLGMKEVDVNSIFIHELDEKGGLSLFYKAIKDMASNRRQDQKPQYTMNGCMYIAKWDYFKEWKMFHSEKSIPYIMEEAYSIEIDTLQNLAYAEFCVKEGYVDTSIWKRD